MKFRLIKLRVTGVRILLQAGVEWNGARDPSEMIEVWI